MLQNEHLRLSLSRQCKLVGISRSSFYYRKKPLKPEDLQLIRLIDEQYLKTPVYGSRSMARHLQRQGYRINRKRVQRLMRLMGLAAIYPRPRTSKPHPKHKVYPYLLRKVTIDRPNQVWAADITYIPMSRGFMYLVAIMDWHSRKVLSWKVSNSLDDDFCVEALQEAIRKYGCPKIFNTDQGSQCPAILISSSPHKIGSAETPWQDFFDPDHGHIRYFGDNKNPGTDPASPNGNRALLEQFELHSSPDIKKRMNACPIVFFKRVVHREQPIKPEREGF